MERLLLSELLGMGFPEVRATKALAKTNYVGIEAAVNWLVEHADDEDVDIPLELLEGSRGEPSRAAAALGVAAPFDVVTGVPSDLPIVTNPDDSQMAATVIGVSECKVVLVVPSSLGMSAGKIGAQCAHAVLGLYRLLLARRVPWLGAWEGSGEKTVVLAVESGEELLELGQAAAQLQLPSYLVYDAGRTEVASGTATVLAIGGVAEVVDRVTGHLSTLR